MVAAKKKGAVIESADVVPIKRTKLTVCLVGTTPLIYNRMSEKAKRELLMPSGRKSTAERAQTSKHDPRAEFRASVYRRGPAQTGPTRLLFPSTAFKNALAAATLDAPTKVTKAKVERNTFVEGDYVDVYGVPELFMATVRNSDMNHTPDIRTRAILREWACALTVSYTTPILNSTAVSTLLAAAGMIVGVGDYRQQKGAGSYGLFELCNPTDKRFKALQKHDLKTQDEALEACRPYDFDSEELLEWWDTEYEARFTDQGTPIGGEAVVTPTSSGNGRNL